uniref:PLAT domain-containing protein n=1 Tax=Biomphalaria glabrata TaxID=6526 RepID=A0A2C9LEW7_BIOGL
MKGSWDNSDTHILCNQKRNLFQSGSEDWFLLTTKGDLGKIHSIEVWTDFSGAHPSWYLKSIYVQNMLTGETWVCKYNSWFSCDFDNTNLKADIPAIEEHEYMRCTFLQLASRTQLSLRNEHLWFGMIAKSPSNVFTRVSHPKICIQF